MKQINFSPFSTRNVLHTCETRTGDTLGKVLLQEDVHYKDRRDGEQTARFHPYDKLSCVYLYGTVVEQNSCERGVQILELESNGAVVGEEGCGNVVIVPVPYNRQQEYGEEGGACVGDHYLDECAQR